MSTNDKTTRDDLVRALRSLLPLAYEAIRAREHSDDPEDRKMLNSYQCDVDCAEGMLRDIKQESEESEESRASIFQRVNESWLTELHERLAIDGGITNPSAVAARYALSVRRMYANHWKPDDAAVAICEAETWTPDERIERYCHEHLPLNVARYAADRLKQMHNHPNLAGNAWEERALSQIFAAEGYA